MNNIDPTNTSPLVIKAQLGSSNMNDKFTPAQNHNNAYLLIMTLSSLTILMKY